MLRRGKNMNADRRFFVFIVAIAIIITPGCKDSTTDIGTNDTFPASNVSYSQYIQPIFNTYCATVGCHISPDPAGNPPLSLESRLDVTHSSGIVIPGNADASRLVLCIEWQITPYMPLDRPQLSPNKIKAIKTWINEGAKNN